MSVQCFTAVPLSMVTPNTESMNCLYVESQPRTQACSRYPSDQRRLGTERDSPRRIFPTSLTGDVTSEIAEDDWERGW